MPNARRADETTRVQRELEAVCGKLAAGDRLPTHRELMRRHRASERTMLTALEMLQRAGRIERRNGIGTFVTGASRPGGPTTLLPRCDADSILAIARPDGSFFDRCLEVVHRMGLAAGRRVVIHPMEPGDGPIPLPPPGERPAGVLLFHHRFAPMGRQLLAAGMRVALVGVPPVDVSPEIPCVHGDHQHGGFLATHHLVTRGHRRLAILGSCGLEVERTHRWRGHQIALAEARRVHGELHDSVLTQADLAAWEEEPGRAVEWWRSDQGASGIAAWNDYEAARLLAVFTRANMSVPDDVGLVGYDDLPLGRVVHPPLTTVDQQIEQQVRVALSLLSQPTPPPASHATIVTPTLVMRRSSEGRVR
jgi:hypothetical protein